MSEIIIDIDTDGTVKIEVEGHVGPGCTKLTEKITEALGTVEKQNLKPEFYKREEQKQRAR